MKKLAISGPALAVLLVLVSASGVFSYVLYSPNRTWESTPWYWVDNRGLSSVADGDGGTTRVINAINSLNAWNGAGAGRLVLGHNANLSAVGFSLGDRIPMLNFTDPLGECTFYGFLACTYIAYYQQRADGSWRITDADIVTNSTGFSFTSEGEDPGGSGCSGEYYIEGIMVHEIGHGLGLNHTTSTGATMLSSVPACSNAPVTTETDDENGVLALYGSAPCTGCQRYHGHLTGFGNSEYEPSDSNYNDSYYYYGFAATHTGWLAGPAGTDFDLYLEYQSGSTWTTVASAATASSSESLSYYGPAGNYRWRVTSNGGSGIYRFYWNWP